MQSASKSTFKQKLTAARRWFALLTVLWLVSWLAACASPSTPAASPTPNTTLTAIFEEALLDATRLVPTNTLTPSPQPPTSTPSATPTQVRTPPVLPGIFSSDLLAADVQPQTYVEDTCQYLKARWDPNNSAPGTVVMVVMYHSITEDGNPLIDDSQIHHSDLVMTLEHAYEVGFETITTEQLADFLQYNTYIPRRSLLLIVDDRKRKEYYETHFIPFLERYNWTITNAWISAPDTPEYLWQENQEVVEAGWVDVQAHGVVHNIPIGGDSTEEYILNELAGARRTIEERYGKAPVGFIWPGGGFTARAVEIAKEVGYRVGFTTNPRGPVMYNWIPQAAEANPNRPYWLPEIPAGDPLLTLPRYWSTDAAYRIDDVIAIGDEAAAYAEQNRAVELEYYDIVCKPLTGEIPEMAP